MYLQLQEMPRDVIFPMLSTQKTFSVFNSHDKNITGKVGLKGPCKNENKEEMKSIK